MGGKKVKTAIERVVGLYKSPRRPVRYGAWGLSALAVLTLVYLIYALSYLGKVYPGVMVGSRSFAGKTAKQVSAEIEQLATTTNGAEVTLITGEHKQTFSPQDISWKIDPATTADRVISFGRDENKRLGSFFNQLKAPFTKSKIEPAATFDEAQLEAIVGAFADSTGNPAQDATAKLINDKLVATSESAGTVIDEAETKNRVLALLGDFNGGELHLELKSQQPTVILASEDELKAEVEKLSVIQLSLKWPGGSKKLTRAEIRQTIGFTGENQPGNTDPQAKKILTAKFTVESVQNFLTSIANLTDSPAAEPQLVITDGKLSIAKQSSEGSVVDLAASAPLILAALNGSEPSPIVELVMKADHPVITESNLDKLGIKERIGFGVTSMGSSPANRRHNIANGVSLLSSALVKPGEEFSTVAKLGAVDNTTGFLPELVIKDDRTVPEFGGGLCQVSTTLFRAVLNAGLKVTERQNHSYRVSYYEPPIGLDATIYLPKPDLKFLNDTPSYILIQAKVVGNKVQFELWGTSDGRTSSVSNPIVSNIIPPPDPIYTDSDTLPIGETKITDHAHIGATAVAYYTVTRNGQVINRQTFKSVYKALPERGLHGTNESLPPTNPPQ